MKEFCCEDLKYTVKNKRTSVSYEPIDRRFIIEGDLGLEMKFCPWCGSNLPKALRDEWFETLEKEYSIVTDIGEARSREDIPSEFWTDQWWKERGL